MTLSFSIVPLRLAGLQPFVAACEVAVRTWTFPRAGLRPRFRGLHGLHADDAPPPRVQPPARGARRPGLADGGADPAADHLPAGILRERARPRSRACRLDLHRR